MCRKLIYLVSFVLAFVVAVPLCSAARQQDAAGLVVMEGELYDAVVPADTNEFEWVFGAEAEFDGYSRDGYMRSLPEGTNIGSDITRSARLDYNVEIIQPGTLYIWGRVLAPTSSQNSFHLGDNGQVTADRINVPEIGQWVWHNVANDGHRAAVEVIEPGMLTINCWMRESGMCIDKILLTSDPNYVPAGLGPRDSMLESMLSIDPSADLVATGDLGMILSIGGIDVNDLILGTTTSPTGGRHEGQELGLNDNFDLNSDFSADDEAWVDIIFDLPVTKVFLVEKGGNDSGLMVPLNRMGLPMDDPTPFTPDNFGKPPYKVYSGADAGLMIVTPEAPIWGIRILPLEGGILGIDPVSISAIAGTILAVKPFDSLDYLSAADLDPNNGDPNTLVEVLAINGNEAEGLVLGTTTSDGGSVDFPAANSDNFDLTIYASLDGSTLIETVFDSPVTTVFIMERGANDMGLIQPLDEAGNPIGAPVLFVAEDMQFQDSGLKIVNQNAGGMAITPDRPIYGICITPAPDEANLQIDPASISGIPAPIITAVPVDDMTFGVDDANNAILTSINGINTNDLVLGVTTGDPATAGVEDDFNLERNYGNDLDGLFLTMFNVPVTTIFIVEKDGNDDGLFRPVDAEGNPVGGYLPFSSAQFSSAIEGVNGNGDNMSGTAITADVPVYGIEIWAGGIDPYSISAIPVPRGLVSYWNMDEDAGVMAFADSAGSNDGVGGYDEAKGGLTSGVAGKFGNAIDISGANGVGYNTFIDAFVAPTTGMPMGSAEYAVSFWVQLDVTSGWQMIYQYGQRVSTHVNAGCVNGTQPWHLYWDNDLKDQSPMVADQWQFVVMQFNGTHKQIWVDGIKIAESATQAPDTIDEDAFRLGNSGRNHSNYDKFDGMLDDVAVWNKALTAEDVAVLWNDGAGIPANTL